MPARLADVVLIPLCIVVVVEIIVVAVLVVPAIEVQRLIAKIIDEVKEVLSGVPIGYGSIQKISGVEVEGERLGSSSVKIVYVDSVTATLAPVS